MDSELIWLVLLFIILPLLEKIFKKRRREPTEQPGTEYELDSPETDAARQRVERPAQRKRYKSELERLIAEELGLDVPRPAERAEAPPIQKPPARKPPAEGRSPYTRLPRSPSGAPQPRSKVVYPHSRVESRPPPPEPSFESLEVPPDKSLDAQAINLDDRAIAASKAGKRARVRKKAPPVARLGAGRGPERRPGSGLPDAPGWSSVKKAIVWSEILGPPKALRD